MLQTVLSITLLVGSGAFDAWTTNHAFTTCNQAFNCRFTEINPAVRPAVGHPVIYLTIPAGDLAVYGTLRLLKKPRAAKWYAFGAAGAHFAFAANNLRQSAALPKFEVKPLPTHLPGGTGK